ncbi:coenzyme A pyrophosphatase [Thermogemmatispora aurantia]|jgi:8-oxo-dGTP pyrophosphatase MutT (NUDIX family)|uniref:Coenzyme A pyrophosphatase n=1 Tax=Thermogemmatispora aurantia TaxID=2045279 RepID=A0A5J4K3F1_9CHLR|nr:CoA pyrophosphatase [Thermogemmatispora aurantia]GER82043.1 coenzyme A pyrophosphatase [Thermogemmatispora aurantia]
MNMSSINEVVTTLRSRLAPPDQALSTAPPPEIASRPLRRAAVLLPLFEAEGLPCLLLIRRAPTLRTHSGEIAFPGGSVDPQDRDPVMTALREAQEELGLPPERSEVLGLLSPSFTLVTNFWITPVVAFLPAGPGPLTPQASEVAEVIRAPLPALADPRIFHSEVWDTSGLRRVVYFYDYGPYRIWGATARILHQLLSILEESTAQ